MAVREKTGIRRFAPLWIWPVLLVMAAGTIWLRLWAVRMTYALHESERNLRNLKLERDALEARLASARSPRHLEGLARKKFGLAEPKAEQLVRLK